MTRAHGARVNGRYRSTVWLGLCAWLLWGGLRVEQAEGQAATKRPIVLVHGAAGFDDVLGFDYWGNDWGSYVLDPCDAPLEVACNPAVATTQRSYVASLASYQSSEPRGLALADAVESYLATTGAEQIHFVTHSQGGLDARKAARVLRERRGARVVDQLITISAPHRGTPVAKHMLDHYQGSLVEALAELYGDAVHPANESDAAAAMRQQVFGDYDPHDGQVTGVRAFNQRYPGDASDVRNVASFITAQHPLQLNPALAFVAIAYRGIDGDGYAIGDADDDGAAGVGNGDCWDRDDDGLVGINAQQLGIRLGYRARIGGPDEVAPVSALGAVHDPNVTTRAQMTSLDGVLDADHMDVVGVGPDLFDEEGFYAAIVQYLVRSE